MNADLDAIVDRFAPLTDGPASVAPIARRFAQALEESDGDAALEIGVRAGGMSAIFCALAPPTFMILSVDPSGRAPYFENGHDVSAVLSYDERYYAVARRLLGGFPNSMLFRLDADTFLQHLLPHLRWWLEHEERPRARRFLSFVYLDGRHDAASVVHEALAVLPRLAPRGCIVVDNIDKCPSAATFLAAQPGLRVERLPPERLALTRLP